VKCAFLLLHQYWHGEYIIEPPLKTEAIMPKQDYLENWMAIYYYLLALNIHQFSSKITL